MKEGKKDDKEAGLLYMPATKERANFQVPDTTMLTLMITAIEIMI
jgi:hypothetical protein